MKKKSLSLESKKIQNTVGTLKNSFLNSLDDHYWQKNLKIIIYSHTGIYD